MELKDVYAFLEAKKDDGTPAIEKGVEMATVLKTEFKKRNDEAATHRTAKNSFEEQLKKVRASLEIGDEDELESALEKLKALKKGASSAESESVAKLQKQIEKMQNQIKAAEDKATAEERKRKQEVMTNRAIAALKDATRPSDVAELIMKNLEMKDDGTIVFKDSGEEFSLEEGSKKWLSERPEFLKNYQVPGAGGSGGSSAGAIDLSKAKTQEEYERMRAAQNKK